MNSRSTFKTKFSHKKKTLKQNKNEPKNVFYMADYKAKDGRIISPKIGKKEGGDREHAIH